MFNSKEEALNQLMENLNKDVVQDCLVLSLSKKGIYFAREIGLKHGFLEGDFLFMEKITSPENSDTILGIVSETKDYILIEELIESFEITDDFIFSEIERIYEEKILDDIYQLRGGESIISLENRNVLLVDESANTGLRLLCAIKSCVSKNVRSINVAIPLIAKETAEMVEKLVDNLFFVKKIEDFVDDKYYFKENK